MRLARHVCRRLQRSPAALRQRATAASLVRKGLFTSATHERAQTYEFHPLFRQYLLDKAERTDSKRVQRLRLRAAAFLVREERIEEAVELYLSAGAGMRAAALMTSHARPMDLNGRGQTLAQWAAWAEEYELEVPVVLIRLGYTRIDQGRLDEAERLFDSGGGPDREGARRGT